MNEATNTEVTQPVTAPVVTGEPKLVDGFFVVPATLEAHEGEEGIFVQTESDIGGEPVSNPTVH